jgi:hypothetical protein
VVQHKQQMPVGKHRPLPAGTVAKAVTNLDWNIPVLRYYRLHVFLNLPFFSLISLILCIITGSGLRTL